MRKQVKMQIPDVYDCRVRVGVGRTRPVSRARRSPIGHRFFLVEEIFQTEKVTAVNKANISEIPMLRGFYDP